MYVRPNGNGTIAAGVVRISNFRVPLILTSLTSPPTPVIYGPLQAVFSNGTNELQVAADEVESTIYATLSDTPPAGMTSNLNLAEATVTLLLRAIGSASPVLSNVGRVVSTTLNQCAYDLQSTDIALLAPGWYKGSFKVLFPSGQTREFPGLLVTVVPAAF
jgi:hypothetical protein